MVETGAISNELKKLLRHSSHYLAGLLGAMALGFVSFPIFTRVFSVADYGTIDFVQKILLVLIAVSKMGTQNSALRFYDPRGFAADPQAAYRYYSTMFYGMALTAGGVSILFLAGVALAPAAWVSPPLDMLLYLGAALIFLRAMDSILWSFLRIEERTKAYNVLSVATKGATIAAVCILLPLAGRSPRTFFLGMTLSEAALAGGRLRVADGTGRPVFEAGSGSARWQACGNRAFRNLCAKRSHGCQTSHADGDRLAADGRVQGCGFVAEFQHVAQDRKGAAESARRSHQGTQGG